MTGPEKLVQQLVVREAVGLTKVRVGQESDGGYVGYKEIFEKTQVLYSYGIGNDVGFEKDFISKFRACEEVRMYDPSINALPETDPKFFFEKRELGSGAYNCIDYDLRWSKCAHHRTLKIDIEWHEWDCLINTPRQVLRSFDQIIVEFHILPVEHYMTPRYTDYFNGFFTSVYANMNDSMFKKYAAVLDWVKRSHSIVHMHGNNSLSPKFYGGVMLPPLLEVTFLRNDLATFEQFKDTLPIAGLDFPCKPYKPEIVNFYPFK